jgi:hypothetical protein
MKKLLKRLWRRMIFLPEPLVEPPRLTDSQLYAALAVDSEHPVFLAMLELATRAQTDAREQARACIHDHAECSYYLGAEWALESLIDYARTARRDAERKAAEANAE